MSLTNEPERLTPADARRTTAQRAPRRRSTVSRTLPVIAPRTWPDSRERAPRTVVCVTLGARAPRPTEDTRARAGAVGVVSGGSVTGVATGTTGGCAAGVGVAVGVGVGVGVTTGTSTAPAPPVRVTDVRATPSRSW